MVMGSWPMHWASVAQLDRASDFGSEGCRFESCPTRHIIKELRLSADWSLKTDVLSVAKLRLTDEEKKHRQAAQNQLAIQRGRGQMTFGDALEIYRARLEANPDIKSKTKDYYQQRIDSLLRTWPGLKKNNVRDISKQDCLDWASRYEGSATAFNNTAVV